ncbi:hypothetical protein BKA70DRAFT_1427387 [Coprinopsis sp. MPI-PUGE-AT-0042]|nr:hypothetical protein BKA70DRAFT_1427387 [Coprinopsis sp. MPI-PUGE-AT-0042]
MQTTVGGHDEAVQALSAIPNVDVNAADHNDGETAIHMAALQGREGMVQALLKVSGVDIGRKNKKGKTAPDVAKKKGFKRVAELLEGLEPRRGRRFGRLRTAFGLDDRNV